jgi:hypothetical protein
MSGLLLLRNLLNDNSCRGWNRCSDKASRQGHDIGANIITPLRCVKKLGKSGTVLGSYAPRSAPSAIPDPDSDCI